MDCSRGELLARTTLSHNKSGRERTRQRFDGFIDALHGG